MPMSNPNIGSGVPDPGTEKHDALTKAGLRAVKQPLLPGPGRVDRARVFGALDSPSPTPREDLAAFAKMEFHCACNGEQTLLAKIGDSLLACESVIAQEYKRLLKQLKSIDPFIRINEGADPLGTVQFATIAAIVIVCVGLMSIPLIGVPLYMLNFVTESILIAVSTAFLGLALPVGLHTLSASFKTETARTRFMVCVCLLAFIAAFGWILLFATSYGPLMMNEDGELPSAPVGIALMAFAMASEGLTATAGWLGIEHIVESHQTTAPRPEHREMKKETEFVGDRLIKSRMLSASIAARRAAYEAGERVYVQRVLAVYDTLKKKRDFGDDEFFGGVLNPTLKPGPQPRLP